MRLDRRLRALALVTILALAAPAVRADVTVVSKLTPSVSLATDAVSDLEVRARLRADRGACRFGGLSIENGADVRIDARFVRSPGGSSPILESLRIEGDGVKSGIMKVRTLSVARDGTFAIDLDPLLPKLPITKVEKRADGSTRLDIAGWWTPDAIVTRTGEVKVAGLTVARLGFNPFARSWPLRLEDLVAIVESSDGGPSPIATVRGTLEWDVKVVADAAQLPVNNTTITGTARAETSGVGVLENGRLSGTAECNVTTDLPNLGGLTFGTQDASISLESLNASVASRFKLDVPLDPAALATLAKKGLKPAAKPSKPSSGLGGALGVVGG